MARLTETYCKAVASTCKTVGEFWNNHRSVATKAYKEGYDGQGNGL